MKFVTMKRPSKNDVDVVERGRNSILKALLKQRKKHSNNETTGLWYFADNNGTYYTQIRYGTMLVGGKDQALLVGAFSSVAGTFDKIEAAVNAGELDTEIERIAASYSVRHKKAA